MYSKFRTFALFILIIGLFGAGIASTFAAANTTCQIKTPQTAPATGGDLMVSASVQGGVAFEYAQLYFSDNGGHQGFLLDGNGNGESGDVPHWFSPNTTYTLSVTNQDGSQNYGCNTTFRIQVTNGQVKIVSAPVGQADNYVCQFDKPDWMNGRKIHLQFWNSNAPDEDGDGSLGSYQEADWAIVGTDSSSVSINFFHRAPDNWGYRLITEDETGKIDQGAYIPILYNNGADAGNNLMDYHNLCMVR